MEHRDRAVELRLDRWIAGNREIYFTELSDRAGRMLMLMLSNGSSNESRIAQKSDCRDEGKGPHNRRFNTVLRRLPSVFLKEFNEKKLSRGYRGRG